jgi:hypothetical protein
MSYLGDGDLPPRFRQDREQARAGPLIACLQITRGSCDEQVHDLTHFPARNSRGVSSRQPRPVTSAEVTTFLFRAPQHRPVRLHRELLQVRCPIGLPPVLGLLGVAVTLGEGQKAAPKRMPDQLQQDE